LKNIFFESWEMSWLKTLVKSARETARDLNVVARETARELTGGKVYDFGDLAAVREKLLNSRSLTSSAELIQRLPPIPAPAEFLTAVIFAVAQNPLLRRSCGEFPPASLSAENPRLLPTAEDVFSMALFELCRRSLRAEPAAWAQLLESYFRSTLAFDAAAPPAAWLRRLLGIFAADLKTETLAEQGSGLVRSLRVAREQIRAAPGDRRAAREAAELAQAVHRNLVASEARRTALTSEKHAELSEINSEGEIYEKALEAKVAQFTAEAAALGKEATQLDPETEAALSEKIAQVDLRMQSILSEAAEAQATLTIFTGEISALRDKIKQNESAVFQVRKNLEIAISQNRGLILKEEAKMAAAEAQARLCGELGFSIEAAAVLPETPRNASVFPGRAAQACQDFLAEQASALLSKREALRGLAGAEISEGVAQSALAVLREAESVWSEVETFSRRFVAFVDPEGPLRSASDVFAEIKAVAEPFKEKAAELALLRELSQESPSPPPPPAEPAQLKRKDSFEDLLGI